MDAGTTLSIFLGVLAVVATLASAVAVLLATKSKVTIEGLRGDRDDQERRITRLEGEVLALTAENSALHAENDTLRSMKDATAAVERLAAVLAHADNGRQAEHHDILAAIQSVSTVVVASHDETRAMVAATAHTHA